MGVQKELNYSTEQDTCGLTLFTLIIYSQDNIILKGNKQNKKWISINDNLCPSIIANTMGSYQHMRHLFSMIDSVYYLVKGVANQNASINGFTNCHQFCVDPN